ncbi:MAG: LysM peptidoglycan-binding domain-containing M23 family metallopeptidase [Rhizobiales bacterium]|nr:LysM peptidoglycan-binding domain-containing M23 family metallopeptidase [Hyphomicrobiales bacterium]
MRPFNLRNLPSSLKAGYLLSAGAAVLLSACSSSMERFADNPWNSDPVYTASVPKEPSEEKNNNDNGIASRPLASPNKPAGDNFANNGYNYQRQQQATAQISPNPGGQIRIEPGMTLFSVARANGMTVGELAAANGISAPYAVRTGQMINIPTREELARIKTNVAQAEPAYAAPQRTSNAGSAHTVRAGETLFSLGRQYNISPYAIADANGLSRSATLRSGQIVTIPGQAGGSTGGGSTIAMSEPSTPAISAPTPPSAKDLSRIDEPQSGSAEQIPTTTNPEPPTQAADSSAPQPGPEPGLPGMRWPVKGKVISEFGSKPNGLRNEGINIAVPEGTSVRASESGIVAYAGNELKGYGNLVLIRHDGGWVTAYAHNKELFVKRGDAVKRGDIIAKAGQTGSVSTPQVHFEVRKGATAMDPMKFLGPVTAAN